MARLPASVLKELAAKAIDRAEKATSAVNENDNSTLGPLMLAHKETGNYYLMYNDAVRAFLIAGYSEKTAEKTIKSWYDYDLISIMFKGSYKLIGFDAGIMEAI